MNVTSMGLSQAARWLTEREVAKQAGNSHPYPLSALGKNQTCRTHGQNDPNDPTWTCPVGQISDL
jgi:hypothetical protein